MDSRHLSTVVRRAPSEVYEFAVDPDNLPRWAAGLVTSKVTRVGDALVVESAAGPVRIVFVERNTYGVLDHRVTTPDGTTTDNPMRVVVHPEGAEVVLTVRRRTLTDEELDRDVDLVRADLERLRTLLEAQTDQRRPGSGS